VSPCRPAGAMPEACRLPGDVDMPNDPDRNPLRFRVDRQWGLESACLTDAEGPWALPEQRNTEGHLRVRGAAVVRAYLGDKESLRRTAMAVRHR